MKGQEMNKIFRVAYEDSEGQTRLTKLTNIEDADAAARVLDGFVVKDIQIAEKYEVK